MSLYHDGWFLSGDDGRLSWETIGPGGDRPSMTWRLFDLASDFSQSTDLADRQPRRLAEMQALWRSEATRNNVFPLDHRFGAARYGGVRAAPDAARRTRFDFWGKEVSLPSNSGPRLFARSFTLDADLVLDRAAASGVVAALGSRFGGWSLFLDQGHPVLVFARSTDPAEITTVRVSAALPAGRTKLRLRFATKGPQDGADVTLEVVGTREAMGTSELARARLPSSALIPAGGGETLDIGRDLGGAVADYRTPGGRIEGDILHVMIERQ